MKFTVISTLTALATAAPSAEPRTVFFQYFGNVVAQTEAFNPNNLTFSFTLTYTDGTNYRCSTYHDLNTDISANTTCNGTFGQASDVTATVGFPSGEASIQDWAAYAYNPYVNKTYTASISTENPIYTCGHSGTPGVPAKCFNEYGYFLATSI
ncbi:hypothetical protein Ct61P_07994 [Colletotrichum tofieldiae]|nr:hypothetical protein Ct61P_07994 [Colletotrichum tofieldiae]